MTDPTAAAREKAREIWDNSCWVANEHGVVKIPNEQLFLENMTAAILAAEQRGREAAVPAGWRLVPVEPTEAMHDAARDWSYGKYGKPIGTDASAGCWAAMLAAALHKGADDE